MGGITAIGCTNPTGSSNSYNLSKGDFQVGANYRYFHSWRHFVGTEEQPQRQTTVAVTMQMVMTVVMQLIFIHMPLTLIFLMV